MVLLAGRLVVVAGRLVDEGRCVEVVVGRLAIVGRLVVVVVGRLVVVVVGRTLLLLLAGLTLLEAVRLDPTVLEPLEELGLGVR